MPAGDRNYAVANPAAGNGAAPSWALELLAQVGQLSETRAKPAHPRIPWEACHPVNPFGAVNISAGAGSYIQPDLMGPTSPYWWDLREITAWGWTAGTVTVYRNFLTSGEQVAVFSTPGNFTWSTQKMLRPDDDLKISVSGITGNVQFQIEAIAIETAWLPEYLL